MRKSHKRKTGSRRLPIVPTLGSILVALYTLLLVAVALNIANFYNGGALAIYSIMAVLWGITCAFLVKKLIRLGRSMIPLAASNQSSLLSSSASTPLVEKVETIEMKMRILGTFDPVLKVIVSLMGGILFGLLVFGTIVPLSLGQSEPWIQVTFGLIGVFNCLLAASLIYHLERLIQASQCFIALLVATMRDNDVLRMTKSINMMRSSQLMWLFTGSMSSIPHLLVASGTIVFHFYVLLILLSMEATCAAFALYSTKPVRRGPIREEALVDAVVPSMNHEVVDLQEHPLPKSSVTNTRHGDAKN